MWSCTSHPDDGGPCLPNAVPVSADLVIFPPLDCVLFARTSLGDLGAVLLGVGVAERAGKSVSRYSFSHHHHICRFYGLVHHS